MSDLNLLQSLTEDELFILETVSHVANKLNYPCYIIGGFVRDKILLRDYKKDLDFVCLGSGIILANQVSEVLKNTSQVNVFKNFGTAQFKYKGIDLEFVGARKESYQEKSRKPIVEIGTIEDDQNRRDFSINALAISLNKNEFGKLIDPFNGLLDLKNKNIRTPLDPAITLSDDPLRMMRAIRFATQLNFSIDEKTLQAIATEKERIQIVSQERITDELNKILLSEKPSIGFQLLFHTELLEIIFPELFALHGVEIVDGKGHKDNLQHTFEVLDNICLFTDNLWMRWAALLHDIAKPITKKFFPKQGWTFHGHEVVGSKMVKPIFKKFKLPLDAHLKFVEKLVLLHLRPISLTKENVTDSAIRRLLFDAGDDLDSLMTLCNADITTKNRQRIIKYKENFEIVKQKIIDVEERDHIRNFQPPISGELIMETFNLKPDRNVGLIKDFVRDSILDGIIPNEYEAAYKLMLQKGVELGLNQTNN